MRQPAAPIRSDAVEVSVEGTRVDDMSGHCTLPAHAAWPVHLLTPYNRRVFDVVGVGANSVDFVYRLPGLPSLQGADAKLRVTAHSVSCGGQVATALATCARFGLRAAYVGAVGDDDNGRRVMSALQTQGVDLSHVVRRHAPNQFAAILLDDRTGERIVLWDRPGELALTEADLPAPAITAARMLLVDDVDPRASLRAAQMAAAAGVPTATDLDHLTDETEPLIRLVSHPIVAEHVPEALTGEADLERALRKLRRLNPGPLTVTIGARGSVTLDGDRFVHVEAFDVRAVDTTGSGDVFRGAYIFGVLHGLDVETRLRWANAAAAVSCTRHGALRSVPTLADVQALHPLSMLADGPRS